MILAAADSISRFVYPQTGSFRAVLSVDNMPSYLEFTLRSGGGDQATYTFDNKRFVDYLANFSHIYNTGGAFKFELVKSGNQIATWINDTLSQSYQKDAFFPSYIDRIDISNPTTEMNFDFSFYGARPNLTFSDVTTDDSTVYSGSITNSSNLATRILAATGQDVTVSYPSTVSTGVNYYSFSGDFVSARDDFDLIFDFDFGKVEQTVSIVDPVFAPATGTSGFLNFSISDTTIGSNSSATYALSQYSLTGTNINVELRQIERIGYTFGTGTGIGTGNYSGYIDGSGYLESYDLTGSVRYTVVAGVTGTAPASGYGTKFYYPSGTLYSEYSILASGYESGNLATGVLQGYLAGIVGPGSGKYRFSGSATGTPTVSVWAGGTYSTPTGIYTGSYNYIENLRGNFSILSSGDMSYGAYTVPSDFTNIERNFNLSISGGGITSSDFFTNGWYSGAYYRKSGGFTVESGALIDIEGQVSYFEGVNGIVDVAILSVYNENTRYDTEIRGTLQDFSETDRIFAGFRWVNAGSPTLKSIFYYPSTDVYILE